jgi:hypothetical protein
MSSLRRAIIALTITAFVAACGTNRPSATSSGAPAATTHTITGTFALTGTEDTAAVDEDGMPVDGEFIDLGQYGCAGTNGYDDIETGLQVQVSNEAGTAIGTGELGLGEMTSTECRFSFAVQNLPIAKFYKITVGHRGELDYSYQELQAAGWNVGFTLG